ncbi:hypothetical protein G9A89_003757 [Geosiphon pyriformis]|nr:hypothetical protein G9A89_003757 [Geosiphon pyriformis]
MAYAPIAKLDNFTGEEDDTQVWLNDVEKAITVNGWNDPQVIYQQPQPQIIYQPQQIQTPPQSLLPNRTQRPRMTQQSWRLVMVVHQPISSSSQQLSGLCQWNLGTGQPQNPNSQNYLSLLVTPEDASINNLAFAQKQPLTSNIPSATITEDESLAAIFPFEFEETTAIPLFSEAALKAKPITTIYTDAKGQHICVPATCGHFKTLPREKLLIELEEEKEKPTWEAYQVFWADADHNELPPILSWNNNPKEKQKEELTWETNNLTWTDNKQEEPSRISGFSDEELQDSRIAGFLSKELQDSRNSRIPVVKNRGIEESQLYKGKERIQTPAATPKEIQLPCWKKHRVKSPTAPSYYYTPGSAINISSADASTLNATLTVGRFQFQSKQWKEDLLGPYGELSEEKEEEESEDQEFIYQNPITENPEVETPNFQAQQSLNLENSEIKTPNHQRQNNPNSKLSNQQNLPPVIVINQLPINPVAKPIQQSFQLPPQQLVQQQPLQQLPQQPNLDSMAYAPIAKLDNFTGKENNAQVWLNDVEKAITANRWNDARTL